MPSMPASRSASSRSRRSHGGGHILSRTSARATSARRNASRDLAGSNRRRALLGLGSGSDEFSLARGGTPGLSFLSAMADHAVTLWPLDRRFLIRVERASTALLTSAALYR